MWSEQLRGLESILREGLPEAPRVSAAAVSFSNSDS
jgi:hypothetical protein